MKRKNAMLPPAMKSKHKDPQDRFWCECGNQKTANSTACERCTFLDGSSTSKIIPTLRILVSANLQQIVDMTGLTLRGAHIALARLRRTNRVKSTLVAGTAVYELISC